MIFLLLLGTVLAAITLNLIRFRLAPTWNKLVFCGFFFVLTVSLFHDPDAGALNHWGYGVFILFCAYSFKWIGGLASAFVVILLYSWLTGDYRHPIFVGYASTGLLVGLFLQYSDRRFRDLNAWQMQLHRQAKQLSILKDIGLAMMRTTDLANLLHIILTAITAGYGLGFNRAMLLLVKDDEGTIQGEVGIGSMSEEEGFQIWNNVYKHNMDLQDFISLRKEAQIKDVQLNDLLRGVVISPEHRTSILHQALKHKKPYIIREIDTSDPVQVMLRNTFHMNSFAVVPLINKNKNIGLILVDNNVNHQPLSIEQVDAIVPLAAQASVAIENARLYEQTKQLSVTDGLTGLYNQSYAQRTLELLAREAHENGTPLSVVLMDIDFFKHYNDRNGHLEGNQLLIQLSGILQDTVGKTGIPCRFGGEEFVALLPGSTLDHAREIADTIRSRVEACPFRHREFQPEGKLTLSLGVASYEPNTTADRMLRNADAALYHAKRCGKNRVSVYEAGLEEGGNS